MGRVGRDTEVINSKFDISDIVIEISPQVLNTIVLSAIETFPKESFGVLSGNRLENGLEVKSAFTYQIADRSKDEVRYDLLGNNMVDLYFKLLSGRNIIGDYHSHICKRREKFDLNPSTQDERETRELGKKRTIKKYPYLGIITAIKNGPLQSMNPEITQYNNRIGVEIGIFRLRVAGYITPTRYGKNQQIKLQYKE